MFTNANIFVGEFPNITNSAHRLSQNKTLGLAHGHLRFMLKIQCCPNTTEASNYYFTNVNHVICIGRVRCADNNPRTFHQHCNWQLIFASSAQPAA